jgi:hypothetical protein
MAGHVLWPGNIEGTDESGEVILAEPLIDMLIQPSKEKGVECFSLIISVVRHPVWVEEDSTQFLLQHLHLI